MRGYFRIAIGVSLALNALLLPIGINQYLRLTYTQTIAHWRAKIIPPERVFIGDSITAGGGDFGHITDINLATTGLDTRQIAGALKVAQSYNPRLIFVMAGTNDIMEDRDPAALMSAWRRILADPRVIVTLIPHTRRVARNVQVDRFNEMIERLAHDAGRKVIAIPGLTRSDGTLQPRYTMDGTHLTPDAYAIWRHEMDDL